MAIIAALKTINDRKTVLVFWENLGQGDQGNGVLLGSLSDKTVQVTGDFSGVAILNMEGSMDNATWAPLTDAQGTAIAFGSAGMEIILENPLYVRPNVGAGDGSTDIDVRVSAAGLR